MAHAHEGHHDHGHGHHGDHDGDFHPRKISFSTVHAMLLKNTPPARHGAVQLGEDHTTPRMAQALAFYRKDMQDTIALSASPHLPWGTPWAGTTVGAILGLTYGMGTRSTLLRQRLTLRSRSQVYGDRRRFRRSARTPDEEPCRALHACFPVGSANACAEGWSFWFDV